MSPPAVWPVSMGGYCVQHSGSWALEAHRTVPIDYSLHTARLFLIAGAVPSSAFEPHHVLR